MNLLHHGQTELGFSELVNQTAHTSEGFAGVDGRISPQLDVAYFEDLYQTIDA